jgi:multimeric flavodoxin WrbA
MLKQAPRADRSGARKRRLIDPCSRLIRYLDSKNDILLLTTSTRYRKHTWDVPKTTQLARRIHDYLKHARKRVTLLDVAALTIHTCEGNISGQRGNNCGVPGARLPDHRKNPTGQHRCWASINNKDDQLYKISRELFKSRAVVFFVSVRWGQANSVYQRLFERLSWIENRVSTLREAPIPQLKKLEAGIVVFGQNWKDAQVLKTQKQNFKWFGWKTPAALSFAWQYTRDAEEESLESYRGATREFGALLQSGLRCGGEPLVRHHSCRNSGSVDPSP